jgi:hypothetical protein
MDQGCLGVEPFLTLPDAPRRAFACACACAALSVGPAQATEGVQ